MTQIPMPLKKKPILWSFVIDHLKFSPMALQELKGDSKVLYFFVLSRVSPDDGDLYKDF